MTWFELMHKDTMVTDLNLNIRGDLLQVAHVASPDHMPYGTLVNRAPDTSQMDDWWKGRTIPRNRRGFGDILEGLEIISPMQLVLSPLGISLTDHYWIKPRGSDISWNDINPFGNTFPEDLGDIMFGLRDTSRDMDLRSPDSTCDGMLEKRWCIFDGNRCLVKGGNRPFSQEPYNEVIASRIADLLHIPHVDYSLMFVKDQPCSICDNMIGTDTELASAFRASFIIKRRNDESFYDHYVRVCDSMGLDIIPSLDRMIVLDHLIMNTDRHTNNFGIIRDADSLEWIGAAPVFDSGSSLCHDDLTENIYSKDRVECKPFKRTFKEQIDLVSSFDWVDSDALDRIPQIAREVLSPENG